MSEYKYYDYLKKYSTRFINSQESWTSWNWGRRSGFTDLLSYRAYTLASPRNILFEGVKIKGWFFVFGSLFCIMDIWGVWYFQDIHQKYSSRKWIYYQPYMKPEMTFIEDAFNFDTLEEKRPMTRMRYADAIKLVYYGKEDQDTVGIRRFRYR